MRKWVANAIGVGVFNVLAKPIRSRMNRFTGERISGQLETVLVTVELRERVEQIPSENPEPFIEAVEQIAALNADLFNDFLIEVVEKFLAGIALPFGNLGIEFLLKLVELELNLLWRAAFLIDARNAFFKIDAGLNRTENLVTGSEDAIEQAELVGQQFVNTQIGGVVLVEEVDNHDIELLSVAVASPDPLLDALRILGQVIIDHKVAELKVDSLGCRFRGDHDGPFIRFPLVGEFVEFLKVLGQFFRR